jgi:hypothetical protein
MTTHEFASLLSHLLEGFGAALNRPSAGAIGDVADALRKLPDKSLKEHVKDLAKLAESQTPGVPLAERLRACPGGDTAAVNKLLADVKKLKKLDLDRLLRTLGFPPAGRTVPEMKLYVESLLTGGKLGGPPVGAGTPADPPTPVPNAPAREAPAPDAAPVEHFVRLYKAIRDEPDLSIDELRIRFEPFRAQPKHILQQVARHLGLEFDGTRDEVAAKMREMLEILRISRIKGDIIRGHDGRSPAAQSHRGEFSYS